MYTHVQAGTVKNFSATRDTGWYTVEFPESFETDGRNPQQVIVNAQIQTRNGEDTPGLRLRNVSNTSFEVRMDEIIANKTSSSKQGDLGVIKSSGAHPNAETLGWVATAIYG